MAKYLYTVKYQYGTYSGSRIVCAEDGETAVAIVRKQVRKDGALPMAYESYKIIGPVTEANE